MGAQALVTGAAGLVGSEVVRQLTARGVDVVCAVRGKAAQDRLERRLGVAARCEYVDLEDFQQVRSLIQRVEPQVVFHTAAKVAIGDSVADASGQRMIEGNQDMTHFVCEAMLEQGQGLLVHVSSIAALGTEAELIDETTPFTDFDGASAYTRSKFLCQQEVARAGKLGLRTVVVCPSVVLGVGSGVGQLDLLFGWIRRGLAVASRGEMGYVDVRDVARAMIVLSELKAAEGEVFVLNGANLSFAQFVETFGKPWGKGAPKYRVGRGVFRVAGVGCRVWAAVFGGKPLVTRAVADYLCGRARYDGAKISRVVPEFSYTPIADTAHYVAEIMAK